MCPHKLKCYHLDSVFKVVQLCRMLEMEPKDVWSKLDKDTIAMSSSEDAPNSEVSPRISHRAHTILESQVSHPKE